MRCYSSMLLAAVVFVFGGASVEAQTAKIKPANIVHVSWSGTAPVFAPAVQAPRAAAAAQVRKASFTVDTSWQSAAKFSAGPKPKRWCGWWMRTQRGGGPELNVAWNWSKWGQPTQPQVGAVVVWRHHVGEIVGQAANGKWLVRSGNDGNQVRTRARSVKGAVFRI